jgi:nitrile hydratase
MMVPGYLWDAVGTITGRYLLPCSPLASGALGERAAVYAVCFSARDLFGAGEHRVTAHLDAMYLERVEDR